MNIKKPFLVPVMISGLSLVLTGQVLGQTFTRLYSFTGGNDGDHPFGGLILSRNTLYGTARDAGSFGSGTLFAVNTDGTGFTNLHSFSGGSEGATPVSALVLSGDTLYGTTVGGGSSNAGTVFAVGTNGTDFATLHSFKGTDGANPYYTLILSGDTLYGTASYGGNANNGTVFRLNTNGTEFSVVHYFGGSDGGDPVGFTLSGTLLYGVTDIVGNSGNGTVFAVSTNGTGFTNLHSFTTTRCYTCFNSDGAYPSAGLILSGNTLYGTADKGGTSGNGTVFAVNTDGTSFTILHSFSGGSDGAYPHTRLLLSGNALYGTTADGGHAGNGTVFNLSFNPQLTITPSEANVILMWPTNVAGFDGNVS